VAKNTEQNKMYGDRYFEKRLSNDKKRLASFSQEKEFMLKYVDFHGKICDVGCSTGEFLVNVKWSGEKYGMEINENAILLAKQSGVCFDKNILNVQNFFDVVVFRGTIQHLPDPFGYISMAFESLKPQGHIVFLATPNAQSIVYKFFNTLPALDPALNYYIPSKTSLKDILKISGFSMIEVQTPYLNSPYACPVLDHVKFLANIFNRSKPKYAFWCNMMNIIARK